MADDEAQESARPVYNIHIEHAYGTVIGDNAQVGQSFHAAPTSKYSLNQIAPPPREFTGREAELQKLAAAVESGHTTIISLRGSGGIGKTALARKLASGLTSSYSDGQIEIDLQGMTTPISPAEAMAHVIHAYSPWEALPKTESELRGRYFSILSGKRILLFLDNASDANQIEPLIPPDTCLLIITSRQRFYFQGMYEMDLNTLQLNEARSLLLKLAPSIGNEADEIAGMCGLLPMALELAGRALRERPDLSALDYAHHLAESQKRFDKVDAALNLSLKLLEPSLQQLWRTLSVFPDHFESQATATLWDMDVTLAADALNLMNRYSLTEYEPNSKRYHLHDLARLVADNLVSDSMRYDLQKQHSIYYLDVLQRANDDANKGESFKQGLELFDLEWRNIQAGQAWAALWTNDDDEAARLCNLYADAWGLLSLRLHPHRMAAWYEAAVKAARRLGYRGAEGAWLGNLGLAHAAVSETRTAIDFYTQALAIARSINDQRNERVWLSSLGSAYRDLGQFRKSIDLYSQAQAVCRATEDPAGEEIALTGLGLAHLAMSETRAAIEFHKQALDLALTSGYRLSQANCLVNLGDSYFDLGDARQSISHYDQALEAYREFGEVSGEGVTLGSLALAYSDLGEIDKAIELYERAIAISRALGNRHGEETNLNNMGLTYLGLNKANQAWQCFELALTIAQQIGDRLGEGNALGNLGLACSDLQREPQEVIEFHERALTVHKDIGSQRGISYALGNLGNAYSARGEQSRAFEYYEEALRISRVIGDKRGEAERLWGMARAFAKTNNYENAIARITSALVIFEQIEDPRAKELRQLLDSWQMRDE